VKGVPQSTRVDVAYGKEALTVARRGCNLEGVKSGRDQKKRRNEGAAGSECEPSSESTIAAKGWCKTVPKQILSDEMGGTRRVGGQPTFLGRKPGQPGSRRFWKNSRILRLAILSSSDPKRGNLPGTVREGETGVFCSVSEKL